jgi:formylglycine-generating enzyme required for sulfatase activity
VIAIGIFYSGEEEVSTVNVRQEDKQLRAGVMKQAKAKLPSEEIQRSRQEMYPDMLYVPNGPVLIGALRQEFEYNITGTQQTLAADGEFVAKPRSLNGFFIDRFEWPNRLKDETGAAQSPEVKITHDVAVNACKSVGKRLCTASEWEKACKGFENYIYSYGDSIDEEICNYKGGYRLGVDEECKSSYGVYGMSAGPREWTSTDAGSGARFVTKGGSLRGHEERSYRCAYTGDDNKSYTDINLSFRCCRSLPASNSTTPSPAAE